MKTPQNEPYHRSRHRTALHAWVVAATAVASIGMPAMAAARNDENQQVSIDARQQTPAQAAQRVAKHWLERLKQSDVASALASMRLPRDAEYERDVVDEAAALSDWLRQSDAQIEPVSAEQAGHWALTTWRLGEDLVEPITLYHPASDGLVTFDDNAIDAGDWQVVPQGMADDLALKPLYNVDHDALLRRYEQTAG